MPFWETFVLPLLMLGCVVGFIIGAMLILCPQMFHSLNQTANRWISTRGIEKPLEKMILIDHWFYQYRRISGGLLFIASVTVLTVCTSGFDRSLALLSLRTFTASINAQHLDVLVLICLLGAVFAALISLFLVFRPSLLRDFEQSANQWMSLRHAIKPLEVQRTPLDEYVLNHVRLAGVVLLCCSLYVVLAFVFWIG